MSAHPFAFLVWHGTQQFLENWWATDKFMITQDSHGGFHLAKSTLHTWTKLCVFFLWNVPCLLRFKNESLRAVTVACYWVSFFIFPDGNPAHWPEEPRGVHAECEHALPCHWNFPLRSPRSSTRNCMWGNTSASAHLKTLMIQGAMKRSLRQCLWILPLIK